MHVNSPRITKNLGACSPRETHMKEPTSAHKLSSYVLLVGMPICPNAGTAGSRKPQDNPKAKTPRQGANTLFKAQNASPGNRHPLQGRKRPAKLSPNTWSIFLSLVFAPRVSFSLLYPMGCLRVKGDPQASRLAGSYFSRPHTPPGLVEP